MGWRGIGHALSLREEGGFRFGIEADLVRRKHHRRPHLIPVAPERQTSFAPLFLRQGSLADPDAPAAT